MRSGSKRYASGFASHPGTSSGSVRTRGPLAAFATFGAFWGAWAALLPEVKQATGASEAELGLALLCIALGAVPALLGTGLLLDRFGPRVLAPALALFSLAVMLPAFVNSVPALAVALFALGAASGAVDVAMNTAVAALEAAEGRRLMQKAHALFSAGVVPASLAVGFARETGAGRLPVVSVTAVLLIATALLNRAPAGTLFPRARPSLRVSPMLLVLGALCAAGFLVESGVESWSALYLETEQEASPALGGAGPATFALAMATGRGLGQGLGARLGDRWLLGGGALLASLGLVLAASAPGAPAALAGFAVAGTGVAVVAPTVFSVAGRRAVEAERGGAIASVTTIAYLGFLAGPPLMGAVSGALGLRVGFLALAGVGILLALA
jgi:MFS family permease